MMLLLQIYPISKLQYTFEVGGRNKKQKQLKGAENGIVVKDGIEQGYMNTIPLWQLGLIY